MASSSIFPLLILVTGLLVVMPLVGGFFLWGAGILLGVRQTYLRCWKAYFIAYLIASFVMTILVNVAGRGEPPSAGLWFFCAFLGFVIHFVVVPWVLNTGYRGRTFAAQWIGFAGTAAVTAAALIPFILYTRRQVDIVRRQSQLREIVYALEKHSQERDGYPKAASSADGKPLLSWRVHRLPYLEQQAIYEQFHLNEPWDSDHNKELIGRMPAVYATTKEFGDLGQTHYRVFSAKETSGRRGTAFRHPLSQAEYGYRREQFAQGSPSTILVLEVLEPVVWTKPDDLELAPGSSFPKLGTTADEDWFHALFADGHIERLPADITAEKLQRYLMIDGVESTFD